MHMAPDQITILRVSKRVKGRSALEHQPGKYKQGHTQPYKIRDHNFRSIRPQFNINTFYSFQSHKRCAVQHEQNKQLRNPIKPTGFQLQTICPLTLSECPSLAPLHFSCGRSAANSVLHPRTASISQLSVKLTSSRCEKK